VAGAHAEPLGDVQLLGVAKAAAFANVGAHPAALAGLLVEGAEGIPRGAAVAVLVLVCPLDAGFV
jgi:hypothetical protein